MSWGIFPLFFAAYGLSVERIGVLKAVYPAVWGVLQTATGPLSDRWGRKGLIVAGMWTQAAGLFLTAATRSFGWWLLASVLLGLGTAMVYPTLIASVSDASHPSWRARSLSVYRFWRDLGYALGALSAGVLTDAFGAPDRDRRGRSAHLRLRGGDRRRDDRTTSAGTERRARMTAEHDRSDDRPPILSRKGYEEASVFTPEALLREARRQKGMATGDVPEICILDPDGDIVEHLTATGSADRHPSWACYHTHLHAFDRGSVQYGVVGSAVGASFAVLVAEQLFASGCRLLISMTSAGQILPVREPPYFIVIDRALRDEGTSYHYLPPDDFSTCDPGLVEVARDALARTSLPFEVGASWTTDAPFRETATAVAKAREAGLLAVEMEAAALYAFATARRQPVLCVAHVTNQMGQVEGDFEKGAANGAVASLGVIESIARFWLGRGPS